jgi:tRNA (guanine37-N1)-methyltransferase
MKFTIITLFPEAIEPYLHSSMLEKAYRKGIVEYELVNLRDFGLGPHKSVDDTPYGGGDGMLLCCEPIYAAVESVKKDNSIVILPTPQGKLWDENMARRLAFLNCVRSDRSEPTGEKERREPVTTGVADACREDAIQKCHYIILCPHYEGYDERILPLIDLQVSMGPYILTGGELPALIMVDSITRLLPGVLGGETSAAIESFSNGNNLEYPQYTKPADFRGMKVPDILLSGHHENIDKWRAEQSRLRTKNHK